MPHISMDIGSRKVIICALLIISALFLLLHAQAYAENKKSNYNIILIGWDGAGREIVKELMDQGKLPNLKKISQEGSFVDIDITNVTDTKAGWAEILTGYDYRITGVYSKQVYGPILRDYSIFRRFKELYGSRGVTTIMLAGWKNMLCRNSGDIYYNFREDLDFYDCDRSRKTISPYSALMAIDRYKGKHFFAFFHFNNIDYTGHIYGYFSEKYRNEFIICDDELGKIITKLKQHDIYNSSIIYVVSDHGFDKREYTPLPDAVKKYDHFGLESRQIFLVTNDKTVTRKAGNRLDIAPTILKRIGYNLRGINPPLTGIPLNDDHGSDCN